jgi:hypothetical protein
MKGKLSTILGVGLALALALSSMLVALPVSAAGPLVTVTADPEAGFADPPLDVDIDVVVTGAVGDLTYAFDDWLYKQNEGDSYDDLDTYPLLFTDADIAALEIADIGPTSDDTITVPRTFSIPGWYEIGVTVKDDMGTVDPVDDQLASGSEEVRVLGIIPEDIAFDVKGAQQTICVKGLLASEPPDTFTFYDIEWSLVSGVELDPSDIIVKIPKGVAWEDRFSQPIDPNNPATYRKVGWTQVYNSHTGQEWVEGFACIHIEAMQRGDIHIYATVSEDPLGKGEAITLHTEKKWGELTYSELDVDLDTAGVQNTEYVTVPPMSTDTIDEDIQDTVYATFYEVPDPQTAGHAIVHWWLFEDTDENQALIDELMDHLASQGGALDDNYWAAHGKYNMAWLLNWMKDLGYVGSGPKEPFDAINFLAKDTSAGGLGLHADTDIFNLDGSISGWYLQNETEDSWPAEDRGTAQATLETDTSALVECQEEDVMIVVLVSYPGGTSAQDDPFNGENMVLIEKGKKQFHKTKIAEVKTPQLRWAGEKIVLEKDWSDILSDGGNYVAVYHLEQQSVGELSEVGDFWDVEKASGDVWDLLDCNHKSNVILQSEVSGEADVNATLYKLTGSPLKPDKWELFGPPVAEIGFVVYYLEFEDVVLADTDAGALIDVTPEASLTKTLPGAGMDTDVAVQVKGFFQSEHSHLMPTARPATPIDLNGDGVADKILPAGRYVLPDDWWLLAETEDVSLRPNYDLMDKANLDSIVSDSELGPYDGAVVTADPSGEAKAPNIGPFNTTQQWSVVDKWLAEATVVADKTVAPSAAVWNAADVRNTVVPDGTLNWLDAPMPQALVIFRVVGNTLLAPDTPMLAGLDKGVLEGYGVENDEYQSPFYAAEIPAHWVVPGGYNWNSWVTDGPYDYWTDLALDSIQANTTETPVDPNDVEVYCDNHGIAAMTVVAPAQTGTVTITATAEFPYSPKKGKYGPRVSDEITTKWGAVELNPHFTADKYSVDVGEDVTFTNATAGGTTPYTKAQWDFNGDGVIDTTIVGTHAQVMANVTHAYTTAGLYTVRLWMTDSTPTTRYEEREDYITVTGAGGEFDPWVYDVDDSGVIEKDEAVAAVNDYFDGLITKANAVEVITLYFD